MYEGQLKKVMNGVREVLNKMRLPIEDDFDKSHVLTVKVDIGFSPLYAGCLFLTIDDKGHITLELVILPEIEDGHIHKVIAMANTFNRLPIGAHFSVYLGQKVIVLKKDVNLAYGRLNKTELTWAIDGLLSNANFYYPIILEKIEVNESYEDLLKENWTVDLYLHQECRPSH